MADQQLTSEQNAKLDSLRSKAETGEQWADICQLEAEMLKANAANLAKICAWVNQHDRCGGPAAEVKDGAVVIYTLCYAGDNAPRSEDRIETDKVTTLAGARRVLGY